MSNRMSVYIGPALAEALEERRPERDDQWRSGAVTAMVGRYAEIVRRSLPVLAAHEWKLICDCMNGTWLGLEGGPSLALTIRSVPFEVSDGISLNGLDEKWGVDGKALVARLAALSFAELTAIVDVVERFWLRCSDPAHGDGVIAEAIKWGSLRAERPHEV